MAALAYSIQPLREASLAARTSETVIPSSVAEGGGEGILFLAEDAAELVQLLMNVGLLNAPLLA